MTYSNAVETGRVRLYGGIPGLPNTSRVSFKVDEPILGVHYDGVTSAELAQGITFTREYDVRAAIEEAGAMIDDVHRRGRWPDLPEVSFRRFEAAPEPREPWYVGFWREVLRPPTLLEVIVLVLIVMTWVVVTDQRWRELLWRAL